MGKKERDSWSPPSAGGPGFHPAIRDIGERGGVTQRRRSADAADVPKDDLPDRKFHTMADIKHGNADDKGENGA